MCNQNRFKNRAFVLVISVVFVLWSAAFIYKSSAIAIDGNRYFVLADDAMISMRYAWNLSHGSGLVWNPGERIEGYSNLFMTLLMSFATLIFDKSNAVLFIQISGIVFMLAIAYITMQIADYITGDQSVRNPSLVRNLSFFGVLSYYPLTSWSLGGMETGLLTLLLLLSVFYAFNYTKKKNPSHLYAMAISMGLAFLTRNDSILFSFLILAYLVWVTNATPKTFANLVSILSPIGILFLFVIGQQIFRYYYYGEWLPNTYTLRLTGMSFERRISNGIGFIKLFLKETAVLLGFSCIDQIFDFRKRKILLISIVFSSICYQVYVGGDPWIYWRIMAPTIPLLIILFIVTINAIIGAISNTQVFTDYFLRKPIFPRKYVSLVMIVVFVFSGFLVTNLRFIPMILLTNPYPFPTGGNAKYVDIAIALNQVTKSDATIGVYTAGTLPYYSEREAIDFLGKSDRYIAKLKADISGNVSWGGMKSVPGHNKYNLDYSIKTLKPTYVQRFYWGKHDLTEWSESNYVQVEYNGITLNLLKDSSDVIWEKVTISPPP